MSTMNCTCEDLFSEKLMQVDRLKDELKEKEEEIKNLWSEIWKLRGIVELKDNEIMRRDWKIDSLNRTIELMNKLYDVPQEVFDNSFRALNEVLETNF